MTDAVLVLNVGSSSIKFAIYPDEDDKPFPILSGKIVAIGAAPRMSARDGSSVAVPQERLMRIDPDTGHDELIAKLLAWLTHLETGVEIVVAGHRVVHGGQNHAGPALVTQALLAELDALIPLAPLHQPHNLAAIRAVAASVPRVPQVACFDTSFHHTQARLAQLFALPRALTEAGVIRYGFHGLSYEYIASTLPDHLQDRADGRVIVAHLGNGASMCAMKDRQSVATSMGFTALDGLMMGRRCGAIDPGVLLYLMDERRMTAREVEHLLYYESGLLGVSGISNDMEVLQTSDAPEATEAIALFCYRAACELAALVPAIDGLDAIIFTAGIGENSALVRRLICERLSWLGVMLDSDSNQRGATCISSAASKVAVYIVPTDEEVVIARSAHILREQ